MLFPWAANDRMERGLAIHALRMAINLGLPAHKAAFQTRIADRTIGHTTITKIL